MDNQKDDYNDERKKFKDKVIGNCIIIILILN